MKRKFGEKAHLGAPLNDSEFGDIDYDFALITEVHSAETTPPPGMSTGASQYIFHGYNIYLFNYDEKQVDQVKHQNSDELLEESAQFLTGIEIERLAEDLERIDRYKGPIESESYDEFEAPISETSMTRALEEYKKQNLYSMKE